MQQQQHTPLTDTPTVFSVDPGAPGGDCHAVVTVRITHNHIDFVATLNMGGQRTREVRWTRRRGSPTGWVCEAFADRVDAEAALGRELAEYVNQLELPFAVANMLPGKRACAEVVAEAAKAVAE